MLNSLAVWGGELLSSCAAAHVRHRAWLGGFSRVHWASEASTEREGLAALTRQNGVVVRYDTLEKLLDHTGVPKLRVWVCRYGMKANATRVSDMLWQHAHSAPIEGRIHGEPTPFSRKP